MTRALFVVAALALSLVAAAASAQSGSQPPISGTGARASPVALPPPIPEPIVIHSREYVGSRAPGMQDPQAARQEAGAALAESRRQCSEQRAEDRRACLQQAREHYDAALRALK